MITEEKITITIRDIMQDFERDFDMLRKGISTYWGFELPSIQEIKQRDYDLYDRIFVSTEILDSGKLIYNIDNFKDEIQAVTK